MLLQLPQKASDWKSGNVQLPVGQDGKTSEAVLSKSVENMPLYRAPVSVEVGYGSSSDG
jgi:hypothetical protein